MRAQEWAEPGGLDAAVAWAPCDSTPVVRGKGGSGVWHQNRELPCCECHTCMFFNFHTCDVPMRTGRTLTLWELSCEGKWTRFGCLVFEVVRPAELFLVNCAQLIVQEVEHNIGTPAQACRILSRLVGLTSVVT
jgi:hypothetical protein